MKTIGVRQLKNEATQIVRTVKEQNALYVITVNGQPVADFMGVRPEAEIRQWIEQLLPSPAQQLVQEGLAIEQTDPQGAEAKYREALRIPSSVQRKREKAVPA